MWCPQQSVGGFSAMLNSGMSSMTTIFFSFFFGLKTNRARLDNEMQPVAHTDGIHYAHFSFIKL